jgi:hypothetical protein
MLPPEEVVLMRATITKVGLMIALLLCVGCGGGANSVVSTPPPPPPPPPVNPAIVWVGDVQVSSGLGDHGIGTSGASGVAMVPDASGGVILVWEDATYALVHAQHIGANGDLRWQITGVSPSDIDTYEASPEAVSDGSGGIIVAWVDGRAGFCDEGFQANCDIYAQRIDSTGNLLWNPSGIPIATASGNHGFSGIAIASDGAGGAIIA